MANEPPQIMAGRARQLYQETEEEKIFRQKSGFTDFEKDMPSLGGRFSFSIKDNLTSYLGARNPFYNVVNPDKDYVWIFDNTAYRDRFGRWRAEFVAGYFVKNSGKEESHVVAWVTRKVGIADDEQARATVAKRIQPLLDQILPSHAININLQGVPTRLGPSGRDGISNDEVAIPGHDYKDGQVITSHAINANATPINTTFASPKGWAVISDVDDTIKYTMTASPAGIIKTTFVDDPEPIPGMPELYQHIKAKLDTPPFWYLSASPYNLYPFLRSFREKFYPAGQLILREASWMNLAGLFANLTQGTAAYKVDRMEKIHKWFPKRKMICIGDSTQADPESYGKIYRKFPGWVVAIYIRKVTGVAEMDESEKNSKERFEKAFRDVPSTVWNVFEDAKELYEKIDALVQTQKAT